MSRVWTLSEAHVLHSVERGEPYQTLCGKELDYYNHVYGDDKDITGTSHDVCDNCGLMTVTEL